MNNVIMKFNEKGIVYRYENGSFNVCAFEDKDKSIIVGTFGGVTLLNDSGFVPDRSYKMLDQKVITAIKDDKEHELWICTKGHGVFCIPYRNFKYYTPSDGLPESSISCMTAMGDEVLVGHLNGRLSILKGTDLKVMPLPTTDSLTGNEVNNLFDFDEQKLFISSVNGIYLFNKTTHVITLVKATGSKKLIKLKHSNSIMSLGFRVLRTYDPVSFDELDVLPLTEYSDNIFEDKKNQVLICSSTGLWMFNKEKGLTFSGEKDTLLASRIVDIAEGKNGWLWYATRGEGIIIEKGNKFIQIKQKDGLSGNMCRTLFLDSTNVVWVATNSGLNKIVIESTEPFKYNVETYSPKNGLLTNEVNYMIKFKHKLWLAHNNGISIFNPDEIHDNKTPPPVYITSILVNEVNLNTRENVMLTHNENHLVISYNGLSFKNPGDIEYKYRLEGLDTNWIYTHYTSADFQNIKTGKYRFVVYTKNNDGYWSTEPATFEFVIEPAWWQTWWFRVLIGVALIGIIIIGRRVKLNVSFK
jgi:ligand-binding sensor domain-containing protein